MAKKTGSKAAGEATEAAASEAAGAPPASPEQQELEQLSEQLRYHERLYRDGVPEISDAAFDDLVDRYGVLADQLGLPEGERIDAKPGADHTEGFQTVQHRVPMLSLEKLSSARRDSKGEAMAIAEAVAVVYSGPEKLRDTLSEITTWVNRKLSKHLRPARGWNTLVAIQAMAMGRLVYVVAVFFGGPAVAPYAAAVAVLLALGMHDHWMDPGGNG